MRNLPNRLLHNTNHHDKPQETQRRHRVSDGCPLLLELTRANPPLDISGAGLGGVLKASPL